MNTQNPIVVWIKGNRFDATEHTIWPDGQATGTLVDGRPFHVPRWCWRELHPCEVEARKLTNSQAPQPPPVDDNACP